MNEQTVDWLLDSDPAIRWQVMQDLLGAPDEEVAVERSRVSREGWGAMLLARQGPDGRWGTEGFEQLIDPGVLPAATDRRRLLEAHRIPAEELAGIIGVDAETVERLGADPFDAEHPAAPGYLMVIAWAQRTIGVYMPKWVSTTYTLTLLRQFGADPDDPVVRRAVGTVADNIVWDTGTEVLGPFFSGETEVCVNSMVLAAGAYFGQLDDGLLDRILSERLEDGGWNCAIEYGSTRSSFHTTINVLEALAEVERVRGHIPEVAAARTSGEEYLLERRLLRRLSDGEVIHPSWTRFSFPTRWHYDVLRGLDHMRSTRAPDPRCEEAVELVLARRDADGRWPLENTHPGDVFFAMDEGDGHPSRWNTLWAQRVLDWYGA